MIKIMNEIMSDEVRNNHQLLSNSSVKFLEYVANNPETLNVANFPKITAFNDGEQGGLQCWPALVSRRLRDQMKEASEGVGRLLKHIHRRVYQDDSRAIADFLELPGEMVSSSMKGYSEEDLDNLIARGDFVLSASGLKCIESNLAANLGGVLLSISRPLYLQNPLILKFINEYAVTVLEYEHTVIQLLKHIVQDAVDRCRGCREEKEINIAFLMGARPPTEPVRPHEINVRSALNQVLKASYPGFKGRTIFCNPQHIEVNNNRVFIQGQRIHTILTVFFLPKVDISSVLAENNVLIYNGSMTTLLCQKLNLALLSEHENSACFDEQERDIIKKYVPWTRKIQDVGTTFHQEKIQLLDFTRSNKDLLVMKPSKGTGGKGVYAGFSTSQPEWEEALAMAIKERNWLVQEYIKPISCLYQNGDSGCGLFESVWGLFTFGNRFIDGFLRLMPKATSKGVINCSQGATVGMFIQVED